MKHLVANLGLSCACLSFALTGGCAAPGDDSPSTLDTSAESIDDSSSSSADTDGEQIPPGCVDLAGVDFGDCDIPLGSGVIHGTCIRVITGCTGHGYDLFAHQDDCRAACDTKEELCLSTGGQWDISSRGGDYVCGQPPVCSNPVCDEPYIPGCNCGIHRKWESPVGCVADDNCVHPACDDFVDVDFRFGDCIGFLGWMVRDGSCQEVKGCSDLSYGFFASRDECNTACVTLQRLCMESDGAWFGTNSFYPARSLTYYDCGVPLTDPVPPLAPCNCGLDANYVAGVGCEQDSSCPEVQDLCPTYDFATSYSPTCGPVPLPGHYGLKDGICSIIVGCLDDFEGPDAFVDPADWFSSQTACEEACAIRCFSDADCPDPDPNDELGAYCHYDKDSNCGLLSNGGLCQESGGVCGGGYDPVCGCDGNYVSNEACITVFGRPMRHEGLCFVFPPLP